MEFARIQPGSAESAALITGRIVAADDGSWLLEDGTAARRSPGCLLEPAIGDTVLIVRSRSKDYVVHVLERDENLTEATLSVHGADALRLEQTDVCVRAERRVAIESQGDVEISALRKVCFRVRDWVSNVLQSRVEHVSHQMTQADTTITKVRSLYQLKGQEVLVQADKDLRMDAERISMG